MYKYPNGFDGIAGAPPREYNSKTGVPEGEGTVAKAKAELARRATETAEIRAQKIEEGARLSIERSGGKREATVLEAGDDGVTEMAYAIDKEGVPQLVAESIETSALKQELAEQAEVKLTESPEQRGERFLGDTLAAVEATNKLLADKVVKAGKLFSGRTTKFLTKALGAGTQVTERARLFANDIAGGSDAEEEQAPSLAEIKELRIPFQLPKETISATIKRAGEEMVWLKNILTGQEKGVDWANALGPEVVIPAEIIEKPASETEPAVTPEKPQIIEMVVAELADGEEIFGTAESIRKAHEGMVEKMTKENAKLAKVVRQQNVTAAEEMFSKLFAGNGESSDFDQPNETSVETVVNNEESDVSQAEKAQLAKDLAKREQIKSGRRMSTLAGLHALNKRIEAGINGLRSDTEQAKAEKTALEKKQKALLEAQKWQDAQEELDQVVAETKEPAAA